MIYALGITFFPIGAFVLRRHWRHATGPHRALLGLVTVSGFLFVIPAASVVLGAIVQAGGEIADAAGVLDWQVLALAAAAGTALAFVSRFLQQTRSGSMAIFRR